MLLAALLAQAAAAQADRPEATIAWRPDDVPPPVIDGRIDDPAWQHASDLGALTQVEPIEGAEPSERTEVLLLLDREAFYLRVVCHDDEPELIRASQMKRDANLDPDDRVEFLIDPFLDRRNAFWFQIGAGGSMGDALISRNGSSFNKPWDGIWLGRSRVTSSGWQAEVRVPVATLNFDPKASEWGFNLVRHIRRRTESARWSGARQSLGFFSIADAGTLKGIGELHQGLGLTFTPFGVLDFSRDHALDEEGSSLEVGMDAVWRITPDVKLSVSLNTDFAETEVDQRQVNLTRFPLFFPEKRDFFLEDSGSFLFGYGGSNDVIPFFSRRIGLDEDGGQVPLLGASKLTAQTPEYTVGVLAARTEATAAVEEADLLVGRISKNVLERSDVGLIYTHGDPDGTGSSSTAGLDFNYRTTSFLGDKNLNLSAWALATESSEPEGDGSAFSARASYPNNQVALEASYTYVDEDFDPRIGFVRRTGVKKYAAELEWRPRIQDGFVRWLQFQVEPVVFTNLDGSLQTSEVEIQPFGFLLESGDRGSIEIEVTEESLDEDFEIADGVVLPVGSYPFVRGRLELSSSDRRPLSVGGQVTLGEFYDGTRQDLGLEVQWRACRWASFAVEYEHNDVELPAGDFAVNLGRLEWTLLTSPDLSWTNFLQYDDVSERLGLNSRVWWILRPGTELFLVLNQGWDGSADSFVTEDTQLIFKLGTSFRL